MATYSPPPPSNILSGANIIQNCPVMFPDGLWSTLILKHSYCPSGNTLEEKRSSRFLYKIVDFSHFFIIYFFYIDTIILSHTALSCPVLVLYNISRWWNCREKLLSFGTGQSFSPVYINLKIETMKFLGCHRRPNRWGRNCKKFNVLRGNWPENEQSLQLVSFLCSLWSQNISDFLTR